MERLQATHITRFHSNRQSDVPIFFGIRPLRHGGELFIVILQSDSLHPKRGTVFGFRAQFFEGRLALTREKISNPGFFFFCSI